MAGEHSTDFCTTFVSHSVGGRTHLSQTGRKRPMETIRCGKSIVHKFIILQVIILASSIVAMDGSSLPVSPQLLGALHCCCAEDQPYRIELAWSPTIHRREFDARGGAQVLD
jgi:hypothetical protein